MAEATYTTNPSSFNVAQIMRDAHSAARDLVARALALHNREEKLELGRAERGGYEPNISDRRIAYRDALRMALKSAWGRAKAAMRSAADDADRAKRLESLPKETKAKIVFLKERVKALDLRSLRYSISDEKRALQSQIAALEAA